MKNRHSIFARVAGLVVFLGVSAGLPAAADQPVADAAYRTARVHLQARRFAEAAEDFLCATASTNDTFAAAAWLGRGEALFSLGDWAKAIVAYGELLKRYPESSLVPRALYARGHAAQHAERLDMARTDFDAFLDRYPTNALREACAAALATVTAAQEAKARQAARAAINAARAAINDALRTERWDEARTLATRFLAAHPDHEQAPELLLLMAASAYRVEDYVGAAEAYRRLLERAPQHERAGEARTRLPECLFKAGEFEAARDLYAELAETGDTPEARARATLSVADCDAALKRWAEAERAYLSVEVLLDCEALRPVALQRLAALYDAMGQTEKANRTRDELRRRYPGL
ncbi:MAG TPA: tetratricopeptide repeat protein [Kiritimatiellia bacterium]|nr:tetratricopeptide repeat protein [Kiritimatiellia bacterium]HRU69820.1 tetratricopeptide repeat protein [Kiritimatiellia bacterium]